MKKFILTSMLITVLAVCTCNCANSSEQKVAIIDIQKIVDQSPQVQALNKEQAAKIQELEKWIEVVKKDVEKQKTQEDKEKTFNKYKETYNKKRQDLLINGQSKMQLIMNNISDAITAQAKAKGYTMVITKSVVVYGGDDITEEVQKSLYTQSNKIKTKK